MSVTTEGNVAIVRHFLDLILEGKLDEACGMLVDDFVTHVPPGLPYGGDYHGPDGFRELLTRLIAVGVPSALGQARLRDAGDCVLVHAPSRFTASSGQVADTEVAELYFIRDGKIAEMDVYYKDPAAVAALAS